MDYLSTVIKPASSIEVTEDFLMGNARNWGHTTLLILEGQYTKPLDKLLANLYIYLTNEWRMAFTIATKWSRRDLNGIQQDITDHM